MSSKEATAWGIHAGRLGEADGLFLKEKVVALGDPVLGDLSHLHTSREDFKRHFAKKYPNAKILAISIWAGQSFRFIHEMKIGEIIIYPSKIDKEVHIGRVSGNYHFDKSKTYPHLRSVVWKKSVLRTNFSQGALYEIGSAQAFFQVKNYADEFIAALEDKSQFKELLMEEETEDVAQLSEELDTQTKDFVLKQLRRNFAGEALEVFIVHLLEKMGYHARQTSKNSPSVDIIAHMDEFGFVAPLIKCQVKSEESAIKLEPVEKLYSRVNQQNEYGLFITLSSYNDKVINFAEGKHNLRLIDGYELVDIVLEHYDELDTKYKNLIPLNRVFQPGVAVR